MLADIASGNSGFADIMFLVAFILFLIAAAVAWMVEPKALWALVVCLGLSAVSLGWLVL
ncbi:MAG: hypothetical protein ABW122_06245 [Ilumatobacteraceae bacterium]